jgi:NAD(P)-dependent dehydrogenase (short-subunit alcohol dehydrogenase family)
MSPVPVLAAEASDLSVWEQLLEVIVVGSIAGIGLSIAFSFLVRGVTLAGSARRDERPGGFLPNVALAVVSGLVCVAAVVFAVYEMVNG